MKISSSNRVVDSALSNQVSCSVWLGDELYSNIYIYIKIAFIVDLIRFIASWKWFWSCQSGECKERFFDKSGNFSFHATLLSFWGNNRKKFYSNLLCVWKIAALAAFAPFLIHLLRLLLTTLIILLIFSVALTVQGWKKVKERISLNKAI